MDRQLMDVSFRDHIWNKEIRRNSTIIYNIIIERISRLKYKWTGHVTRPDRNSGQNGLDY